MTQIQDSGIPWEAVSNRRLGGQFAYQVLYFHKLPNFGPRHS